MQRNRVALFSLALLTVSCVLCSVSALAATVTPFAITAANLTMPADNRPTTSGGVKSIHLGSSKFTATGVGEGTLTIACQYSGPVTQARIPQQCGIVGPGRVMVQAGQTTFSGTVYFVPFGQVPVPGLGQLRDVPHLLSRLPITALSLTAAMMLGFGFRRRARRALSLAFLAVCTLVGAGITAWGAGNRSTMTPGAYHYTISAEFTETGSNTIQNAITTITLTVK